ncbi:hypothetical protein GCM10023147_47720 [Tsukamurella soli]|uniref:Integral membrane bound transporter domain-containing protein n=1 Tax=Tsukamurella soli TaxID=644556 RepID=A0ABP8KED6_9ACTN
MVPRLQKVEVAFRAALVLAVCAAVLDATGHLNLLLYAMFGAFTAVYGSNERYRIRARTVTVGGVSILACVGAGLLLSGAPHVQLLLAVAVMLVPACLLIAVFQLLPPQPMFHTIALTVCAVVPVAGDGGLRFGVAAAAAALSWVVTMSGWIVRRFAPEDAHGPVADVALKQLRRAPIVDVAAVREPQVWWTILRDIVGVVAAGAIAYAVHGGRPYWAMVAAISVLPVTKAPDRLVRALERIGGTLVGVLVVGAVLAMHWPRAALVVLVVVCQFFIESTVLKRYAVATTFITTMVLCSLSFVVPVAHPLLVERLVETIIGSAVAVVLMLGTQWIRERRSGAPG